MHAEAVRDKSGHSLVVVDDIASLSQLWDLLAIKGLCSLGSDLVRTQCAGAHISLNAS